MIKKVRQYDIDWLRIILIVSVFLYHIALVFNGMNWHIKNEEQLTWLDPIMKYLHEWRLPLLFLVSGVGTRYALSGKSVRQYIRERFTKLGLPFIAGIIILVPVQGYYKNIQQFDSLFSYYLHFFHNMIVFGKLNMMHMWFIIYLLIVSYFSLPVIAFFETERFRSFENRLLNICKLRGSFLIFTIPIVLSQYILLHFYTKHTMQLFNDWAYILLVTIYFLYGFVLIGNSHIVEFLVRDRYIYAFIAFLGSLAYILHILNIPPYYGNKLHLANTYSMSWIICLAIIGFGRRHLNFNLKWRSSLNQAIYPFYLLSQTLIVIFAYYIIQLPWNIGLKIVALILSCLLIIFVLYQFLILPYTFMRIIFGLKFKGKANYTSEKFMFKIKRNKKIVVN